MMLFGDFMFAVNDVMGKWLVATYSPGQVVLTRSIAALAVLLPFVLASGPRRLVQVERPRTQVFRVVLSSLEIIFFYTAAAYLPLADVMTFYLAGPIYVAAVSPFLLKEQVSLRQWLAIGVGFVGVLFVLRPTSGSLSWPALISIGGSLCYAMMIVQSRQLRATPDTTLVFWQVIGALILGLMSLPFGWVTPSLMDWVMLSALGVISMSAHMCINRSMKLAPAALIAPIQYTLLLWALLFGWLIFHDVPKLPMMIGAAIIIGAGLFIVERRKAPTEEVVQDLV